jgi:hypothetical protein
MCQNSICIISLSNDLYIYYFCRDSYVKKLGHHDDIQRVRDEYQRHQEEEYLKQKEEQGNTPGLEKSLADWHGRFPVGLVDPPGYYPRYSMIVIGISSRSGLEAKFPMC